MKKFEIKQVIRRNLPETNSSSSHSVSISYDKELEDPRKYFKIENGTLYVQAPSSPVTFGWEFEKYNDPITKLWYLSSYYCYDFGTARGHKKIEEFKRILKKLFNVQNVIFMWDEQYIKELKHKKSDGMSAEEAVDSVYRNVPEVDHESLEIISEIDENLDTIRQFILSPNSWLFTGNDNASTEGEDVGITKEREETEFLLSVELGDTIGRVDVEVKKPTNYFSTLNNTAGLDFLTLFGIIPNTGGRVILMDKENTPIQFPEKYLTINSYDLLVTNTGQTKMMFSTVEVYGKFKHFLRGKLQDNEKARFYPLDFFEDFLKLTDYREGSDYVFKDVHIISKKLGKLC